MEWKTKIRISIQPGKNENQVQITPLSLKEWKQVTHQQPA